tara:strand:+ start:361 stop:564 length:204 start_codon:yes stop_codon:yes gene_type:complete
MVYWQLEDPKDIAFAQIAQGARVDGARLPSGLIVPVTPGQKWIIAGAFIRCMKDSSYPSNVQTQLSE